mmetsp:Transcript_3762/g.11628  ORF Transcript_3762/g.11628 Transcript_3762/m.11628 type:complete len:371 (-) Transcript_3762:401-1513(-)
MRVCSLASIAAINALKPTESPSFDVLPPEPSACHDWTPATRVGFSSDDDLQSAISIAPFSLPACTLACTCWARESCISCARARLSSLDTSLSCRNSAAKSVARPRVSASAWSDWASAASARSSECRTRATSASASEARLPSPKARASAASRASIRLLRSAAACSRTLASSASPAARAERWRAASSPDVAADASACASLRFRSASLAFHAACTLLSCDCSEATCLSRGCVSRATAAASSLAWASAFPERVSSSPKRTVSPSSRHRAACASRAFSRCSSAMLAESEDSFASAVSALLKACCNARACSAGVLWTLPSPPPRSALPRPAEDGPHTALTRLASAISACACSSLVLVSASSARKAFSTSACLSAAV